MRWERSAESVCPVHANDPFDGVPIGYVEFVGDGIERLPITVLGYGDHSEEGWLMLILNIDCSFKVACEMAKDTDRNRMLRLCFASGSDAVVRTHRRWRPKKTGLKICAYLKLSHL